MSATRSPAHALFSARWHRVTGLRPRLRQHVELRLQPQRGIDWYLLVDTASGEVRRLNPAAYEFVGRCDGQTTVQRIWESMLDVLPEHAMSQEDAVQLLTSLFERELLESDHAPDVEAVFRRRDEVRRRRRWIGVNPLAFRLVVTDPSRLIERLAPLGRWIFGPRGLLAWTLLVVLAGWAAVPQWEALAASAARLSSSPSDLALIWLAYPFVKAVHEAAHALALRRWGIVPRRAGLTLLALTPVPFVDASAADGLRQPARRAVISAAGILAELALAALALGVWLAVQPGLLRDLALSVVLIGTVSTLLVNGNPLLRLDGYYVLCDLLDLRNLGLRSARWWQLLGRRFLLGDRLTVPMVEMPRERPWLIAYAPASALFRLALSVGTVLWLGEQSALLAIVVGGMLAVTLLGRPLWAGLRALRFQPGWAPWLRTGAALCAGALFVGVLPLPHHHIAVGVVLPPEQSQLRPAADGFIAEWHVRDGEAVAPGTVVGRLADDALVARRAELQADVGEIDIKLHEALVSASADVSALAEQLAFRRAELARLDERLAQLEVRVEAAGTLVLPHQDDRLGSFLRRGELLGYVMNTAPQVLRIAVPQADGDLLQAAAAPVEVRLAHRPDAVLEGRLMLRQGAAVTQLPSAALGVLSGGPVETDPEDATGLKARTPVFLVDVELPGLNGQPIGTRAQVRLDLGTDTLAGRAARQLRQLLLGHFSPTA